MLRRGKSTCWLWEDVLGTIRTSKFLSFHRLRNHGGPLPTLTHRFTQSTNGTKQFPFSPQITLILPTFRDLVWHRKFRTQRAWASMRTSLGQSDLETSLARQG